MNKDNLSDLYLNKKMSAKDIALKLGFSTNKVVYWLNKYQVPKRTISEAIYTRHNPYGDPFKIKKIRSQFDAILYGIGIGLYWGEGTKANKHSVRLGNTDPDLLLKFIEFLIEICGVDSNDIRYGLQLFMDIDEEEAIQFWLGKLDAKRS